jgi:predicted RNA polymerase sigma factor
LPWQKVSFALYDALTVLAPPPVEELLRAVAVSMAFGPQAGLEVLDALRSEPSLVGYHLTSERAR